MFMQSNNVLYYKITSSGGNAKSKSYLFAKINIGIPFKSLS